VFLPVNERQTADCGHADKAEEVAGAHELLAFSVGTVTSKMALLWMPLGVPHESAAIAPSIGGGPTFVYRSNFRQPGELFFTLVR